MTKSYPGYVDADYSSSDIGPNEGNNYAVIGPEDEMSRLDEMTNDNANLIF